LSNYVCPHCGSDKGAHAFGRMYQTQAVTVQYVYVSKGRLDECDRDYGDNETADDDEIGIAVCNNCGKEVEKAIPCEEYEPEEDEKWEKLPKGPRFLCEFANDKLVGSGSAKWCKKPAAYRRISTLKAKEPSFLCDEHYCFLTKNENDEKEELVMEEKVQRIRWFKANGEIVEVVPHVMMTDEVEKKVGKPFLRISTKTPTDISGLLFYGAAPDGERNALATQYAKMFAGEKVPDDFEIKGNALLIETKVDE
jgi:hypothetical protein